MRGKNTPYIIALIALVVVMVASIAFMALAGKYQTQPVIAYFMTGVFVIAALFIIIIVIVLCRNNQKNEPPNATSEETTQKKKDVSLSPGKTVKRPHLFEGNTKTQKIFKWIKQKKHRRD